MDSGGGGVVSVMVWLRSGWLGIAALLVATTASAELGRARERIAALPKRGATSAVYVPKGWSLELTVEEDLDADGSRDTTLVLLEDEPEFDRERALVVLLRRGEGYVLGGSNVGLLPCWGCSGVKGGDGAPSVRVEKGVLLVDQLGGSRQFYTLSSRFRWSRARRLFELIGEETHSGDALDGSGTETSCDFVTRECVVTVTPPQVDADGHELPVETRTKSWKLPKKRPLSLERADMQGAVFGSL